MTFDEFRATLAGSQPPQLPPLLVALWFEGKGDWDQAHVIAQDVAGASGAWVHAYLHRKEGDFGNAAYWYHRARRPVATESLDAEWAQIASALLAEAH